MREQTRKDLVTLIEWVMQGEYGIAARLFETMDANEMVLIQRAVSAIDRLVWDELWRRYPDEPVAPPEEA